MVVGMIRSQAMNWAKESDCDQDGSSASLYAQGWNDCLKACKDAKKGRNRMKELVGKYIMVNIDCGNTVFGWILFLSAVFFFVSWGILAVKFFIK